MTLRHIATVDDLHDYLHVAIQLEHATIPPYLTALYSLHPSTNADAYRVIRVVAVEEMLHLTLAANLLNAVGGTPDLTTEGFVPIYPAHLPDGEEDFEVGTRAFSRAAIETFLKIERPAQAEAETRFVARDRSSRALLPGVDVHEEDVHFYSIGEFYAEITDGLHRLHQEMGAALFCGDPARQVGPEYYYSGGGAIVKVTDIESAAAAMRWCATGSMRCKKSRSMSSETRCGESWARPNPCCNRSTSEKCCRKRAHECRTIAPSP